MENWQIRDLRSSDIDEICRIEETSFTNPWSRNMFLESMADENNIFLVAESARRVGGYVNVWCVLDEATISNIAVDPSVRGNGLGESLMKAALEAARERGAGAATLEVRKSNSIAISLYNKLGFENVGVRPGYYEKPREDAIIMWKYDL